jgi:hypothetical protein
MLSNADVKKVSFGWNVRLDVPQDQRKLIPLQSALTYIIKMSKDIDLSLIPGVSGSSLHNDYCGNIVDYECEKCGSSWSVVFDHDEIDPMAYTGHGCQCMPEKNPELACLSRGVNSFGADVVIDAIRQFHTFYKLPIVSVGCGVAAIESLSKFNWILVDPEPMSYILPKMPSEPFMKMDYSTVDEIEPQPCVMFLNWCEPNDSTYDMEAITKLKPKGVLSIFEVYRNGPGAAGGSQFYEWYSKLDPRLIAHTIYLERHPMGEKCDIRLVWVHLGDEDVPRVNLPSNVTSRQVYQEPDCVIM